MEVTWKNVWLILHREVRDQLRDRRTLFMVLVLPIMLYPGLGIGMLQMTMYFTEQPRQVVILNRLRSCESLPTLPTMKPDYQTSPPTSRNSCSQTPLEFEN